MLNAGTRLGPYEIQSALGAGGMGEVYKARDTRLDRAVAIKILPATLAADPQFRERFDREARAISQLTHPNICTLYDVGDAVISPQSSVASQESSATSHQSPATAQDSVRFLVMELLDGETLEARLIRGGPERAALPVTEALAIAIQIADALAAAHRVGIVHRDLKPGNIFLVKSAGASAPPVAKLLDFGLAKTSAPAIGTSGATMMPTTPVNVTAQGTILGTFQYMAPEQIEGMEADARTDLFAFGCVLYEMLTGKKAFEGKTRASLLGAILKDEPRPISQVQPIAPASLDRIVATCLAKDPEERWQTARDLQRELKWVAAGGSDGAALRSPESGGSKGPALHPQRVLPLAAAALASAAIVSVAVWALMRPAPVSPPVIRLQATASPAAPLLIDAIAPDLAISPDGARIAYFGGIGQPQLFVRGLDQNEATLLAGTAAARGPFFSPDGEWIAYFQIGALKKVSIHGGPSVTICGECANGNRGATWGADDTIVFSAAGGNAGLRRISAAGGDPVTITTVETGQLHVWPEYLPGAQAILFTIVTSGSVDNAVIAVRDLQTGEQKVVVRGGSQPHYVPAGRGSSTRDGRDGGYLVYGVAGTLRVVGFDPSRLAITGNPVPALEHVVMKANGAADFSLSRTGSLAYFSGDVEAVGQRLAWVDRQGHEEPIPAPTRTYVMARLSPDGQRVALDVRDQQNDIWIWDFSRRVLTRLTTDPTADQAPLWTPDGRRIVYTSSRLGVGVGNLFWQPADGTGAAERLTTSPGLQYPYTFTPDGKSLVLRSTDPKSGPDLSLMSMDGDRSQKTLIRTQFSEQNAEISPDGRWIAYQSNESGGDEIHVRPFPAVEGGHWQISTDGGTRPVWLRSGRELFFVDSRGRIMTVPIQAGASFAAGNPTVAVEAAGGPAGVLGRSFDVSADGKRFLVIRSSVRKDEQTNPTQMNITLNWGEELKRLAPARR
jgi:serine/threonine-protein kinase